MPGTTPRVTADLDPAFRPAALFHRAFDAAVAAASGPAVGLALEHADGSVYRWTTGVLPAGYPHAGQNFLNLERHVKFLLWSRGAFRIYVQAPDDLTQQLRDHFANTETGAFDQDIMGRRVFERAFEIVAVGPGDLPAEKSRSVPLGRHLDGCRIGFDLGASDRKAAAVIDGEVVFSEEVDWNPVPQSNPQWHFDQIMDSLKRAAAHMPRVDAIGGSSAGVIVQNRVKLATLFRGVPQDEFNQRVKGLFLEIKAAWGGIPFEIVNLRDLARFPANAEVTPAALREAGLVDEGRVKVLGMGTLDRALTVKAQAFSKSAAQAIERAGGKAEVVR